MPGQKINFVWSKVWCSVAREVFIIPKDHIHWPVGDSFMVVPTVEILLWQLAILPVRKLWHRYATAHFQMANFVRYIEISPTVLQQIVGGRSTTGSSEAN